MFYTTFLKLFLFDFFLPFFLSFLISFDLIKYFIFIFNNLNFFQNIRNFLPNNHILKNKIPTMGGLIILICFFLIFFLFFYKIYNFDIFILFLFFVLNALIGLLDDCMKCFILNSSGLSIFNKYILQSFVSILYIFYLYKRNIFLDSFFNFYYLKFNINYIYFFLLYFILIGISNSVNITDGLDGLVVFPLILNFIFLLIVCINKYLFIINFFLVNYEYLIFIKYLIISISIIIGILFSFLYYNFNPAKIFLGDVGSLSLGFILSIIFILLKKKKFILINSFIFIIEIISVMLQIFSFYFLNKRIFLMAPLHHHYELLNYKEKNIVFIFWFFSFILFIISLFLYFKIYV